MRSESDPLSANLMNYKCLKIFNCHVKSKLSKCVILVLFILMVRVIMLSSPTVLNWTAQKQIYRAPHPSASDSPFSVRIDKFLEVPQIVWGLNNQKIAFARAALTARLLNRTLLMPSLSASLFYKEIDLLEPIAFDKVFQLDKFNSLCSRFIRLGRVSDVSNQTKTFEIQKGSGRKWTMGRDLIQLKQCKEDPIDAHEVIRIVGKNPFLWHDHWPVKDYAKIFGCLVFIDEIANEASNVISMIREKGLDARNKIDGIASDSTNSSEMPIPYIAVHMRIEKDWMVHCKKLEQRLNIFQICSGREEIMERVGKIHGVKRPVVVYLAVADSLLEDTFLLNGWKEGLLPFEKKRLGVWDAYKKYPYLIQSAIDYEVCAQADVFVGNSFSTFSSLVVLERTQKLIKSGVTQSCLQDVSFAYNILGESGGPQRWMTNMSDLSLLAISYGTNQISCQSYAGIQKVM